MSMQILKELVDSTKEWWAEQPVKTKLIVGAVSAIIIAVIISTAGGK